MSYCQFNLSLDGSCYVRGEKIQEYNGFFTIKEPTFHNCSACIDGIKPQTVKLSQSAIICYFEIEKN